MAAEPFDVKESRKTMASIENFEKTLTKRAHDWRRDGVVGSYEVCTCPKPVTSVLKICTRCYAVSYARLNDFSEHNLLHRVCQRFFGVQLIEAPNA